MNTDRNPIPRTAGLVAAAVTAFREDGAIDLEFIPAMAERMKADGLAGVFVNGTTGEGLSLTVEEREAQAAAWRKAVPSSMKLFIHVGAHAPGDAVRLTAHAQSIGADAIAAMAPGFFKPDGLAGLVDWCAEVAAGAPGLPFYFYHMPSMTGVSPRVHAFLARAADRIPNLAGIKFTHEALDDFLLCQHFAEGRYDMLWGRDEMLLGALASGATGGVGSTYNIAAPLYLEIIAAFQAGRIEEARRLQAGACRLITAMVDSGHFFAALKTILKNQGLPISPRTRSPLPPATVLDPAKLAPCATGCPPAIPQPPAPGVMPPAEKTTR